jgi:hypothetical protein
VHRARAYKGSKLGPEKQARQNPKVGFGTGPAVRPYKNRSKRNTGGKCSICSDIYIKKIAKKFYLINGKCISTPLPILELKKYTRQAPLKQVKEY